MARQIHPRRIRRQTREFVGAAAMALSALGAAAPAPAQDGIYDVRQNSSVSTDSPTDSERSAEFQISNTAGPGPNASFTSRYGFNINADSRSVAVAKDARAVHEISFEVRSARGYTLNISTGWVGQMVREADTIQCADTVTLSGVTGQVLAGFGLSSGSLSLADPPDIGLGTIGDQTIDISDVADAVIRVANPLPTEFHTLRFEWNASVLSDTCEVAIRLGAGSGTTTGCQICGYPSPERQESDGLFVVVQFVPSQCGNGQVDAPEEQCDLGAGNGFGACCDIFCKLEPNGMPCSDGLFCNGDGRCAAGVCEELGNPCAGTCAVCDEGSDACVPCTPTPTGTPGGGTPTPTRTPVGGIDGLCFCDDSGRVGIAQLVRAVNLALQVEDCPAAPSAGETVAGRCFCTPDGRLAIAQLIRAVNIALEILPCPPAPSFRYEDTGLTVIDHQTGLEWAKSDDAGGLRDKDREFTWTDTGTGADGTAFTEYLAGLNSQRFAGYDDWRLPTSRGAADFVVDPIQPGELESILDCSFSACIDPVFGPSASAAYWSSSTLQVSPTTVWIAVLATGAVVADGKANAYGARAMRNRSPLAQAPRFEATDLTVIDHETGLEWVKTDDNGGLTDIDNAYSWSNSGTNADGTVFTQYLAGLNGQSYAGHTDWRLPSSLGDPARQPLQPAELESIVDCRFPNCIHPAFGPARSFYWSSSTDANEPGNAWIVFFLDGGFGRDDKRNLRRARAVRSIVSAPSNDRFEDTGLTVIDRQTKLEWVKTDDAGGLTDKDNTYAWSATGTAADGPVFTEYLAGLNRAKYAGHADWRLPTRCGPLQVEPQQACELQSIVDCRFAPCIDPVFGPTAASFYWSSSTYAGSPDLGLLVDFVTGGPGDVQKVSPQHVRAVRGAAPPPPRFEDTGLTVIDRRTGLEWVKTDLNGGLTDVRNAYPWSDPGDASVAANGAAFTEYLAGLNASNYAGHNDWRLPTSGGLAGEGPIQPAELESILDCSFLGFNPYGCIDPIFGPTEMDYWSSSTIARLPALPYHVLFDRQYPNGTATEVVPADGPRSVRAVRGGP